MSASADSPALDSRNPFGSARRGMWVILLEIGLAIGLAAFIVWWTWPKRREPDRSEAEGKSRESER